MTMSGAPKTRGCPLGLASTGVILFACLASLALSQDQQSAAASVAAAAPEPAHQLTRQEALRENLDDLRAQLAKAPYSWHCYSQIGETLLELKEYRAAATAFEQALKVHPIDKTVTQEKKVADRVKAQTEAERKQQEQMRAAQQAAADNAMLSGMMDTISMMPGGNRMALMKPMVDGINNQNLAATMAQGAGASALNEELPESALPERQDIAGLWINLGLAQSGYGDHNTAAASLEKAFELDPARFDALWRLAGIWREAGAPDKALNVMARYLALAAGRPNPQCCLMIMEIFRSLGMEDSAATALNAAIKPARELAAASPNDVPSLLTLGNLCTQGGLYEEAARTFAAAAKLKPDDPAVINGVAVSQLSLGKVQADAQFISRLESMAAANPNAAYAWYLVGRFQEESGNAAAAAAAYRKAVSAWEASGQHGNVPGHVAVAYAGCGMGDKVFQCLNQLVDAQVGSSQAYIDCFRVGVIQEKVGTHPEEAIEYYSLCLDGNPNYRPAAMALQRIAARNEAAITAALKESDAASARGDKSSAIASRAAAAALMAPGQKKEDVYREILRLAATADKLPPMSGEGREHWMRANAITKQVKAQADVRRALLEYRQALIYAPWQSSLRLSMAACYGLLGRYDDAIRETRMFLEASTDPKASEEARDRIYELEYQWKTTRRELGNLNPFR